MYLPFMRMLSIPLTLILLSTSSPGAQSTATAQTPSGLAANAATMIERYGMHGLSGCVLVASGDRVLLNRCTGLADRQSRASVASSTLFDIASITKSFTAAAVLELVSTGKLSLDTTLAAIWPDAPADKRAITVHQLLTHSAGFPLDAADAAIVPADPVDTFVSKALAARLLHAPGARYAYSNLGYGLLAVVIERASQRPYRENVDRLIQRAGLKQTAWWREPDALAVSGAAVGYLMSDREDVLEAEPILSKPNPAAHSWGKFYLGPTGLLSTTTDLHRWVRALTTGKVLPAKLTEALFTPTLGDEAYGWHVGEVAGVGKRIYRGGLRGGFTSLAAYYPAREITLSFTLNQSQAGWESLLWRSLEAAIAGTPVALPPPTISLTESQASRSSGVFPAGRGFIRIYRRDDVLMAGAEDQAAADDLLGTAALSSAASASQNARTLQIVRASLDRNLDQSPAESVNRADEFTTWLASRAKVSDAVTVLGTVPHPSSAARSQTFVRFGPFGAPVIRLIWEKDRVIAWADGVRLPALTAYRLSSPATLVSFRPNVSGWRTLVFEGATTNRHIRIESGGSR